MGQVASGESIAGQLVPRTLAMETVHRIRESILRGRLRPGMMINQVELAVELGVSRGPVREALRQLEEEGLVAHLPYRGSFVVPVTREGIQELYTLRATLEEFAIGLFMARARPEDLAELEGLLPRLRALASEGAFSTLTETESGRLETPLGRSVIRTPAPVAASKRKICQRYAGLPPSWLVLALT